MSRTGSWSENPMSTSRLGKRWLGVATAADDWQHFWPVSQSSSHPLIVAILSCLDLVLDFQMGKVAVGALIRQFISAAPSYGRLADLTAEAGAYSRTRR